MVLERDVKVEEKKAVPVVEGGGSSSVDPPAVTSDAIKEKVDANIGAVDKKVEIKDEEEVDKKATAKRDLPLVIQSSPGTK